MRTKAGAVPTISFHIIMAKSGRDVFLSAAAAFRGLHEGYRHSFHGEVSFLAMNFVLFRCLKE
jgi:hypothetical protein